MKTTNKFARFITASETTANYALDKVRYDLP